MGASPGSEPKSVRRTPGSEPKSVRRTPGSEPKSVPRTCGAAPKSVPLTGGSEPKSGTFTCWKPEKSRGDESESSTCPSRPRLGVPVGGGEAAGPP